MDDLTTPALIACLAAAWREMERLNAVAFGDAPLASPRDRLIGDYRVNLAQALDVLEEAYEERRRESSSLDSLEQLREFYRQAG
jgi:hypothetical protein